MTCLYAWQRRKQHILQTFISWFISWNDIHPFGCWDIKLCTEKLPSEKEKQRNRMALLETSISVCSEALSAHMSVFSTISVFSTETSIHLRHPLFHVGLTLRFLVKSAEVSLGCFSVLLQENIFDMFYKKSTKKQLILNENNYNYKNLKMYLK